MNDERLNEIIEMLHDRLDDHLGDLMRQLEASDEPISFEINGRIKALKAFETILIALAP